jgi:hypothetical protein
VATRKGVRISHGNGQFMAYASIRGNQKGRVQGRINVGNVHMGESPARFAGGPHTAGHAFTLHGEVEGIGGRDLAVHADTTVFESGLVRVGRSQIVLIQ